MLGLVWDWMLSAGNRDGRSRLGFGGEMDDTELEEGEACSNRDDDWTVDPDIALAYIVRVRKHVYWMNVM